jgi:hypothetical protein
MLSYLMLVVEADIKFMSGLEPPLKGTSMKSAYVSSWRVGRVLKRLLRRCIKNVIVMPLGGNITEGMRDLDSSRSGS